MPGDLMFQFGGLSFDIARESMELLGSEVIPRLRSPARPRLVTRS
jgi:hypothetical protein